MGTIADIARAALAVVFTVAAVAKLTDQSGIRSTMLAFGVRPNLAAPAGRWLPLAELTTAVLLVLQPTARWGGVAALVLLLAFIAGISNVLAQGRAPDCNCFGQIAKTPVSWRTLVRNALLAALAVVVTARGSQASLLAWTGGRSAAQLIAIFSALAGIAAVMVALQFRGETREIDQALEQIRRQVGMLPNGLPVGLRAPGFELPDVQGEKTSLAWLCSLGRPVALVFVSPDCGPCIRLLPELRRWNSALSDQITFAIISNGGEDDVFTEGLDAAGDIVTLVQDRHEIADQYRVMATPSAIVVDPDGKVASPSAGGPDEIEALIRVTLRRRSLDLAARELVPQNA